MVCSLGCSGLEPTWKVEVAGEDGTGIETKVGVASDLTSVVALAADMKFRFNGHSITTPHVAEITADGEVAVLVDAAVTPEDRAIAAGIDDLHRSVIAWSASGLVAYDNALGVRWTIPDLRLTSDRRFDMGRAGSVAFLLDAPFSSSDRTIHYVDPDGHERWNKTGLVLAIRVAANNDVFALGSNLTAVDSGFELVRFSSVDGAATRLGVPGGDNGLYCPTILGRDGSSMGNDYGAVGEEADVVYGVNGQTKWSHEFAPRNDHNGQRIIADNGDLLYMSLDSEYKGIVIRLDYARGDEVFTTEVEDISRIVGIDSMSFIAVGPAGKDSVGIARFDER